MPPRPAPPARRRLATGVFAVNLGRGALLPEQLACAAQEIIDPKPACVFLAATCATPARSAVSHGSNLDYSQTAALAEWLHDARLNTVLDVPGSLRKALRCFRARLIPVATPVLHLGSLIVPDSANLAAITRQLEAAAADFALRLESAQRREVLAHLANEADAGSNPSISGVRPRAALPVGAKTAKA